MSQPLSRCLAPFLAAAIIALSIAPARSDDWPTWRHDPANTCSTTDGIRPPLRLAWRAQTYKDPAPIILASGNYVCVARRGALPRDAAYTAALPMRDRLAEQIQTPETALMDARTGRLLMVFTDARPVYLHNGILIVITGPGPSYTLDCHVLEAGRGQTWSQPLRGASYRSVLAIGTDLYCFQRTEEGLVLTVLGTEDGKPVRRAVLVPQSRWGGGPPSPPGFDGTHLYFGEGHWLHAINASTLKEDWAYYDGGSEDPMCVPPYVIAQGWAHTAQAIDTTDRKQVWQIRVWRDGVQCLARDVAGHALAVESETAPHERAVAGFDVATAQIAWSYRSRPAGIYEDHAPFGLASAGGVVYAAGWQLDGENDTDPMLSARGAGRSREHDVGFCAIDARTGALLWHYSRPGLIGRWVIAAEGSLYGLGTDGFLYRFVPAGSPEGGARRRAAAPVGEGRAEQTAR